MSSVFFPSRRRRVAKAPDTIAPAVQRNRWLAPRPSNALCDHPSCHNGKDPCDEYLVNAASRAVPSGGR
jgi:hypothetical protein